MTSFTKAYAEKYGFEPICRELPTDLAMYYLCKAGEADRSRLPVRADRDTQLREEIGRVEENYRVYGVRRVWRQLACEGLVVAHYAGAPLDCELGLRGVVRGWRVKTTMPLPTLPYPGDQVNRVFQAQRPNVLWLTEVAYVAT